MELSGNNTGFERRSPGPGCRGLTVRFCCPYNHRLFFNDTFDGGAHIVAFAVIESGGKQFKVTQGDIVNLPSIEKQVGQSVEFHVLAYGGSDGVSIGSPSVESVRVTGTINGHGRDRKVIVFKKKRRKQYKKTHGHRQNFTSVRIDSVG